MWRFAIVLGIILTLGCGSAFATSSLVVESKTVGVGASGTVGIFLSNDVALRQIIIPIRIRAITSACYPTTLAAKYNAGGHLSGYLSEIQFINIYDNEDGSCKNGQPGGFGTITVLGTGANYLAHPAPSDPDGFLFSRGKVLTGELPPGADGATPSMAFDFTAPMVTGSFEIDTTCKNPGGHLTFVESSGSGVLPNFTKGVIDVVPCDCPSQADLDSSGEATTPDFGYLVFTLFAGWPEIQDPVCPTTRSDLDCDGFTTVSDLTVLINYFWAGGPPPCNPCSDM